MGECALHGGAHLGRPSHSRLCKAILPDDDVVPAAAIHLCCFDFILCHHRSGHAGNVLHMCHGRCQHLLQLVLHLWVWRFHRTRLCWFTVGHCYFFVPPVVLVHHVHNRDQGVSP